MANLLITHKATEMAKFLGAMFSLSNVIDLEDFPDSTDRGIKSMDLRECQFQSEILLNSYTTSINHPSRKIYGHGMDSSVLTISLFLC